jgi:hypothetical protein
MRTYFLPILLGLGLLWPGVSWATDADACDTQPNPQSRGSFVGLCTKLCDGKAEANEAEICTEVDFSTLGHPDIVTLEAELTTDCTVVQVDIATGSTAAGAVHGIGTITLGTTRLDLTNTKPSRFLEATLTTLTACSDFDIWMNQWWEKKSNP